MLKKVKDIFFVILTTFIIISICVIIWINYFWWLTWKIRNGEYFCVNKEYSIWKMSWWDNLNFFCDNKIKWRCISWIESYALWNNKDLYVLFNLPEFIWKTENEINDMLNVDNPKWWIYSIFQNDYTNKYYAKNNNDIIRFIKINYNDCKLNFYSENNLKNVSENEKMIFNKLKNQ